jgi:hypothetical protein
MARRQRPGKGEEKVSGSGGKPKAPQGKAGAAAGKPSQPKGKAGAATGKSAGSPKAKAKAVGGKPAATQSKAGAAAGEPGSHKDAASQGGVPEDQGKAWSRLVAAIWGDEDLKKRFLNDPRPVLREYGI